MNCAHMPDSSAKKAMWCGTTRGMTKHMMSHNASKPMGTMNTMSKSQPAGNMGTGTQSKPAGNMGAGAQPQPTDTGVMNSGTGGG